MDCVVWVVHSPQEGPWFDQGNFCVEFFMFSLCVWVFSGYSLPKPKVFQLTGHSKYPLGVSVSGMSLVYSEQSRWIRKGRLECCTYSL